MLSNDIKTETVNLTLNWIGDRGVAILAKALQSNQSLRALNLTSNWIGDAGAIKLADCLCLNQTLESIDLRGNDIGDEGARHLISTLATRQNISLWRLNLEENTLSAAVQIQLRQLMRKRSKLETGAFKICRFVRLLLSAPIRSNSKTGANMSMPNSPSSIISSPLLKQSKDNYNSNSSNQVSIKQMEARKLVALKLILRVLSGDKQKIPEKCYEKMWEFAKDRRTLKTTSSDYLSIVFSEDRLLSFIFPNVVRLTQI